MIVPGLLLLLCSVGCQSQVSHPNRSVLGRTVRELQKQCTAAPGTVRLRSNSAKPCTVTRLNYKSITLRNPKDAPEKYPDGVTCEAKLSSAAPRYLRILPTLLNFQSTDRLIIKGPFRHNVVINKPFSGPPIYVPSSYAKIYFKTKDKKRNVFRLNVAARTNNCQRVCNVAPGSTGAIRHGPYKANTFCEWWLEAPEECTIRLRFVKFDVGNAGSGGAWGCSGDYVGVDRGGDPSYSHPNSRHFCGSILPGGVRSVGNKLNVLFNGQEGGFQGFRAIYKVFCSDDITETPPTTEEVDPVTIVTHPPTTTMEFFDSSTTDLDTSTTVNIDAVTTTQGPNEISTIEDVVTTTIVSDGTSPRTTTVIIEDITTTTKPNVMSTSEDVSTSTIVNNGTQPLTTTVGIDDITTTTNQNEMLTISDFIVSSTINGEIQSSSTVRVDETSSTINGAIQSSSTVRVDETSTTADSITSNLPVTVGNQISGDIEELLSHLTTVISTVQDDYAEENVEWDDDEWQDEWDEEWEEGDYEYTWDEEELGESFGEGWGEGDYTENDYSENE